MEVAGLDFLSVLIKSVDAPLENKARWITIIIIYDVHQSALNSHFVKNTRMQRDTQANTLRLYETFMKLPGVVKHCRGRVEFENELLSIRLVHCADDIFLLANTFSCDFVPATNTSERDLLQTRSSDRRARINPGTKVLRTSNPGQIASLMTPE